MQWEYRTGTIRLADEPHYKPDHALNELGLEGWEVIGFEHEDSRRNYLLKRKKV